MTLTIDVKNNGVLTLLRDMERLDLLHVSSHEKDTTAPAAPAPAPAKSAARDIEIINRNAEWLNREMEDVLSYQSLDL